MRFVKQQTNSTVAIDALLPLLSSSSSSSSPSSHRSLETHLVTPFINIATSISQNGCDNSEYSAAIYNILLSTFRRYFGIWQLRRKKFLFFNFDLYYLLIGVIKTMPSRPVDKGFAANAGDSVDWCCLLLLLQIVAVGAAARLAKCPSILLTRLCK